MRVLIGDFEAEFAVQVLCEAFHRLMFGDNYVWILPGYHDHRWWMNSSATNCTDYELKQVIDGHFATEFATHRTDRMDAAIVSGKVCMGGGNMCHETH